MPQVANLQFAEIFPTTGNSKAVTTENFTHPKISELDCKITSGPIVQLEVCAQVHGRIWNLQQCLHYHLPM